MPRNLVAALMVCGGALLVALPSKAQELVESYRARLSPDDHYNSAGERLQTAGAIIRQDRANYHRNWHRDPEDEDDAFFGTAERREILEQLIRRGAAVPGFSSSVVNETPLIKVDIYRRPNGDAFIDITLLQD